MLLSLGGGILGLLLGVVGIRVLLALNPGNIPRVGPGGSAVGVDMSVLVFTAAVSVVTGLVFGLFPALRATRVDLSATLKESSGRSGTAFRHNKARGVLVVAEVALALVLLVGAALLVRTYVALRAVDPGFDPNRVLTMRMSLTGERFAKAAAVGELMRSGRESLESLPEVEAAAALLRAPGRVRTRLHHRGPAARRTGTRRGQLRPSRRTTSRSSGSLLRGRTFTEQDTTGAPG
jgi:hypothetical protein